MYPEFLLTYPEAAVTSCITIEDAACIKSSEKARGYSDLDGGGRSEDRREVKNRQRDGKDDKNARKIGHKKELQLSETSISITDKEKSKANAIPLNSMVQAARNPSASSRYSCPGSSMYASQAILQKSMENYSTSKKLMQIIFSDEELLAYYRAFLLRIDASHHLEAYNDIQEIQSKLQVVFVNEDADFKHASVMYFLHKFYTKYLCKSSTAASACHIREVLLSIFFSYFATHSFSDDNVDYADCFNKFEVDIVDCLIRNTLDVFIVSKECHLYCTAMAEHCSNALTTTSAKVSLGNNFDNCDQTTSNYHKFTALVTEKCKSNGSLNSGLVDTSTTPEDALDDGLLHPCIDSMERIVALASTSPSSSPAMTYPRHEVFRCFCRNFQAGDAEYAQGFSKFIGYTDRQHYLQFCFSAYMFKTGSYANKTERIAAGKKICDTYLSKNSPSYVCLPRSVSRLIFYNHLVMERDCMDQSMMWVMEVLTQLYWQYLTLSDGAFAVDGAGTKMPNVSGKQGDTKVVSDTGPDGNHHHGHKARLSLITTLAHATQSPGTNSLYPNSNSSDYEAQTKFGLSKTPSARIQKHRRSSLQWIKQAITATAQKFSIRDVLNNQAACSIFKVWMQNDTWANLLTFLLEVEECRGITVPSFRSVYFKQIYYKHMHPLAILPVPISDESRLIVENILHDKEAVKEPSSFRLAVNEVFDYIDSTHIQKYVCMLVSLLSLLCLIK